MMTVASPEGVSLLFKQLYICCGTHYKRGEIKKFCGNLIWSNVVMCILTLIIAPYLIAARFFHNNLDCTEDLVTILPV